MSDVLAALSSSGLDIWVRRGDNLDAVWTIVDSGGQAVALPDFAVTIEKSGVPGATLEVPPTLTPSAATVGDTVGQVRFQLGGGVAGVSDTEPRVQRYQLVLATPSFRRVVLQGEYIVNTNGQTGLFSNAASGAPAAPTQGAPGPTGPRGPAGPPGPAGPVGPTQVPAGTNLALGGLVAFNTSGHAALANAALASNLYRAVGVSTTEVLGGAQAQVQFTHALVPVLMDAAPAATENGKYIWLSDIDGTASLAPPVSAGNARFRVGVLSGANGATLTPEVLFQPQFVAAA